MRHISILHVGSFHGNIGDNANHFGFRPWFESLLNRPVEWREFEIRNVYRGTADFGSGFVDAANDADLVVVGGGNYFELWVESSPTGTSISVEDECFAAITSPIFFNALGVDEGQGTTELTLRRFRQFFSRLLGSDQYLVSVRNDGAAATLAKNAAVLPLERVIGLPDGGFFADYRAPDGGLEAQGVKIAVNLACDMPERRFPGGAFHSYESFLDELAEAIGRIGDGFAPISIVLVPHVFSDIKIYADLLTRLPDRLRRENVKVAAYGAGPAAARMAFAEYCDADVAVGMRFHANVVPIGRGVPTIGLFCYDQIQHLYRELEMPERVIDVRVPGFAQDLVRRLEGILGNPSEVKSDLARANAATARMRRNAETVIASWLARHSLANPGDGQVSR